MMTSPTFPLPGNLVVDVARVELNIAFSWHPIPLLASSLSTNMEVTRSGDDVTNASTWQKCFWFDW